MPIDFSTLVISFSTSAQIGLGLVPNPETGRIGQDLVSAKQTIDMLAMLKEKTEGNLTREEESLFTKLLFDLQMAYHEALSKGLN